MFKKIFLIILSVIIGLTPFGYYTFMIVEAVTFDINCGQYLSLAGNANSVEIAEERLTIALNYLEENNITSGDSKLFIPNQPANNIGIWYDNLKTAQTQLRDIINNGSATELEKSNVLMKLRETLYDDYSLVMPAGLCFYPNRSVIVVIGIFIWLLWLLMGGCIALDNYRAEQNQPKSELWGLSNKKRKELEENKNV